MKISYFIVFLFQICIGTKVFLFGGILVYDNNPVYDVIARETKKKILPNKCEPDWTNTTCAKVAVITSAAPDEVSGVE
jgi:hypothetical protein